MTNVIPIASFAHVVIEAGTVTSSTDAASVGKFMYSVAYHDEDGAVLSDYAGSSHTDAVTSAKGWGVPVFDRTRGVS